jgi:hypothetical protein
MKGFSLPIKAYALGLLAACFAGCNKDPEVNDPTLRGDSKMYYAYNNAAAATRLSSIMYNRADSLRPVERFKLVHISDPHLSGWSIANHYTHPTNLLESVAFANQRELRINAMVETGDHIGNNSLDIARLYLSAFFHFLYYDNAIPTFACYGNHDSNIGDKDSEQYIPSGELAAAVHLHNNYPARKDSAGKSYYYADVATPQGGMIRFIILDMLEQPGNEYNTLHYALYSQVQVDWLGKVALREGMTDRHSVVILTHFPFQPSIWGGMKSKTASGEAEAYLCDGDFAYGWSMIPQIVEAYRTRSSINKTYPNKLYPDGEGIKVDFDFSAAGGEFVCYLGGHAHCFALFDIRQTGLTLPPQKMILCSNQAPSEAGTRAYHKVKRAENSIFSNSFNIYAIDTNEKKVYITFFGAYQPYDEPDFPDILTFAYL